MSKTYDAELTKLLEKNVSLDDALKNLRKQGASPVDSIKAIRSVKGVSLAEAKELFVKSNAWEDQKLNFDNLHKQIIDSIEDNNK